MFRSVTFAPCFERAVAALAKQTDIPAACFPLEIHPDAFVKGDHETAWTAGIPRTSDVVYLDGPDMVSRALRFGSISRFVPSLLGETRWRSPDVGASRTHGRNERSREDVEITPRYA